MEDSIKIIHSALEKLVGIKNEFEITKAFHKTCKRRKKRQIRCEGISIFSRTLSEEYPNNEKHSSIQTPPTGLNITEENGDFDCKCMKAHPIERWQENSLITLLESIHLSSWEAQTLTAVAENFYINQSSTSDLIAVTSFLQSIWQRLHTGHWSEVHLDLRLAFSWGSIALVDLLLRNVLADLGKRRAETHENVKECVMEIIQACDRGLLMGGLLEENPLHAVAFLLNPIAMGPIKSSSNPPPPPPHLFPDGVPEEAALLGSVVPLDTQHLPSLQDFLLRYKECGRPLKMSGIADAWPALSKWDFPYLRKMAGARTVPVEVGRRYSDPDWSQTLMTIDSYLARLVKERTPGDDQKMIYLAQHQLLDQIPEFLSDIMVPDYCYTGERDPVVNAWIGPGGTVTPLHFDPDNNILVQVYGYKTLLIFDESNSRFMYVFEDNLLSNTSKLNLEEEVKKEDLFNTWPLLKQVKGYYLTLGPGDALYLPPKWWHYVKSLSNSISLSFWWN